MEKQHDTILFDMDGTLFDTERLYHAGWNYAGVPDDVYRQMIGRNPEEIRELLLRYPELGNPDEIRAEKEKYTNSLLEKEMHCHFERSRNGRAVSEEDQYRGLY